MTLKQNKLTSYDVKWHHISSLKVIDLIRRQMTSYASGEFFHISTPLAYEVYALKNSIAFSKRIRYT